MQPVGCPVHVSGNTSHFGTPDVSRSLLKLYRNMQINESSAALDVQKIPSLSFFPLLVDGYFMAFTRFSF